MLAAQRGQHDASRALYDRFRRAIMGYCLACTRGDRDMAKDLLQDIFVRVFRHLPELEYPEHFKIWLWTIAHRVGATYGKSHRRYNVVLETFALECDVALNPEDKTEQAHRVKCVRELLATIDDPTLHQIVMLKYTEPEHTTRQIAQMLDMPHGTVTVKLMRFRQAIKLKLAEALAIGEVTS